MITLVNICLWVLAYGVLSWFLFGFLPRQPQNPPLWMRVLTNSWCIIFGGVGLRLLVCWTFRSQGALAMVDCAGSARVSLLLFEVGTIWLIGVIARRHGLPSWLSILYAWGPLSVIAWVYGWPAIATTFLLLAAIALFGAGERWSWAAYLVFGLAAWTNFAVLLMLPLMATRRNLKWSVLVLPALVAAYFRVPLQTIIPMEECVSFRQFLRAVKWTVWGDQVFLQTWFSRDALFCIFTKPDRWLLPVSLSLCCLALGLGWIALKDCTVTVCAAFWMWLIVLFPGFGPEHLLTLAALLVFTPQRSWLVILALAGVAVLGQYNDWLLPCFWLPLLGLSLYDAWRQAKPSGRAQEPPKSLDIIVPTLNEAGGLDGFLADLREATRQLAEAHEVDVRILVADGGSKDGTLELLTAQSLQVIPVAQPGRGAQIAEGIAAGKGDVILMLHADARLAPDVLCRLCRSFERFPGLEWGILGHTYTHRPWRMRFIECSNRARLHLGGIAFGDQGVFVRRDCLERIGGMPRIPLMEDIELSLRLTGQTCRISLSNGLTVSTRRWERASYKGYMAQVLRLCWSYLFHRALGADTQKLSETMYAEYYKLW